MHRPPRMRALLLATAAMGALVSAHSAQASGFALKEQSAAAQGTAFAGASSAAEDASSMFYNPAAIGFLAGSQAAGSLSYIVPEAILREASASRAARLGGGPISGNASPGDAVVDVLLPAAYGVWAVSPDLRFGLAVTSPWGLVTEYDNDWVGRYHALHSELRTFNISPTVAFRLNPMVSIGGGFQAQYAHADLTNAVDFGSILAVAGAPVAPGSADGKGRTTGDDWGFGFTAGILVEPWAGTRAGLSYRSAVRHELRGAVDFSGVPAGLSPGFADGGARANLMTPDVATLGIHQRLGSQWAVMGEAAWTNWSHFDELRIRFDDPLRSDTVTPTHWDDTWFFALGVEYRPTPAWTVKAGVAYDQSPVPERYRTPRIPDQDRAWMSLGLGYQVSEATRLDAAYTHIFVKDATLRLTDDLAGPGALRGNLSGTYDSRADIISVQVKHAF